MTRLPHIGPLAEPSPLPTSPAAWASLARIVASDDASRAEAAAADLLRFPTDYSGGATDDPNDAAEDRPEPDPLTGSLASTLAGLDGADAEAWLVGLQRAALRGAVVGRTGGVRRATGRSQEHVSLLSIEDADAVDEAVAGVWLAMREAHAIGARWRIPGHAIRIVDALAVHASDVGAYRRAIQRGASEGRARRGALRAVDADGIVRPLPTATTVREPSRAVYVLARRYGQRRRPSRIRLRDGISPLATDHRLPPVDADLSDAELIAAVPTARRRAFELALAGWSTGRNVNGNAKKAVKAACAGLDLPTATAIVRRMRWAGFGQTWHDANGVAVAWCSHNGA